MHQKAISIFSIFLFSLSFNSGGLAQNTSGSPVKLIAFSSDATKNDKQQIFIMDADGNGVMQVAHGKLNCYNPKFSPDGSKIIFCATNVISDYIYLVDLKDTSTFEFPKFISGGTDALFSPDGRYIMFRAERDDINAIFLYDLVTDSTHDVSDGSLSTHADFSPDGRKIIYSSSLNSNFDLVVLNLEDTTENALTVISSTKDAELYGTFSPDGSLIAYAAFDIRYKGTVHVCNSDGSSNKVISKGMGSSYNPKFSPDGELLAFVSEKGSKYEIYICGTDGSSMKQLTNKNGSTIEFDWSPDGRKIVYESLKEGVSSINIIDIETGSNENLTGEKANNINPSFQK